MSETDNPTTNNMDAPRQGASKNLVLLRHLVGLIIVLSANPFWILGAHHGLNEWVSSVGAVVVLSATIVGLMSLFFTKSQAPKWRHNFAMTAWVLAILLLIGHWSF